MLTISMTEITVQNLIEKLLQKNNAASKLPLGIARDNALEAYTTEYHRLRALNPREVVERKFKVRRLGASIPHPERIVGVWIDGVVTSEKGAPLPSDEERSHLIQDVLIALEVAPVLEDGKMYLSTGIANPAFTA